MATPSPSVRDRTRAKQAAHSMKAPAGSGATAGSSGRSAGSPRGGSAETLASYSMVIDKAVAREIAALNSVTREVAKLRSSKHVKVSATGRRKALSGREVAAVAVKMAAVAVKAEQIASWLHDFASVLHTPPSAKRGSTRASLQGGNSYADLIAAGALLQPSEFAERLGWTRQALSKALAGRRVFYVEPEGQRYYPSFFADMSFERKHLEAVSKKLGDLPGSSKLQFFMTPKGSLRDVTPLEALKAGHVAAVTVAAEGFANR